jgi:hypothetical protein
MGQIGERQVRGWGKCTRTRSNTRAYEGTEKSERHPMGRERSSDTSSIGRRLSVRFTSRTEFNGLSVRRNSYVPRNWTATLGPLYFSNRVQRAQCPAQPHSYVPSYLSFSFITCCLGIRSQQLNMFVRWSSCRSGRLHADAASPLLKCSIFSRT